MSRVPPPFRFRHRGLLLRFGAVRRRSASGADGEERVGEALEHFGDLRSLRRRGGFGHSGREDVHDGAQHVHEGERGEKSDAVGEGLHEVVVRTIHPRRDVETKHVLAAVNHLRSSDTTWAACTRTYHPYMHTYNHTYIQPYINTSNHTCIHAYIQPYIHTCIHKYIQSYMHT